MRLPVEPQWRRFRTALTLPGTSYDESVVRESEHSELVDNVQTEVNRAGLMSASRTPGGEQARRMRMSGWMAGLFWSALFLLVHVAAPWGLSLLSTRHGWIEGRPGAWNLLALLVVIPGIAATVWLIAQHYLASPQSFLELTRTQKMLTRGPYAVSRNPMYVSELAFWFGWALFYGSPPVLVGALLWWLGFNLVIVPSEERALEAQFGEAYRAYKAEVPRWLGWPHG